MGVPVAGEETEPRLIAASSRNLDHHQSHHDDKHEHNGSDPQLRLRALRPQAQPAVLWPGAGRTYGLLKGLAELLHPS